MSVNGTRRHIAQPMLDLIGKYESRGDYEIVYGGIAHSLRPRRLTTMTIAQVREWQENVVKRGAKSSAAGKYQIIRKTLDAIIAQTKIPTSQKFDADTQDLMALHLLDKRGFQRFLKGEINANTMAIELAKEWASLPVPQDMKGASRQIKAGQSYYAGDGLNKAHATVAEVRTALAQAKARYDAAPATKPKVDPGAFSAGVKAALPASAKPVGAGAIVAVVIALAILAVFLGVLK